MAAGLTDFNQDDLRIAPLLNHYESLFTDFLSHSVDKMFEEAELSGVLLLTGRKLKEFPSELALKFDISDVIFADLGENRLHELPACICELGSMETLRVRSAGLRMLPNTLHMLSSLTYLDLSCNHLTSLPPGVCSLRLQVLLLTGNLLETLPREIRQFADTLNELDVSCNRLRTIPVDIALLKSLRVLNLRANRLGYLPSELSRLELRVFNLAENQLTELPFDLCYMPSLVDFCVDENPLSDPPVKVCLKGREHIFKWLRSKSSTLNDGSSKQSEWSNKSSSVTVNATMRRQKHYDIYAAAENEAYSAGKRMERRSRSTRFSTLGGSDSGYASTADEHRLSSEYQLTVNSGSLFGINESLRSPPSDSDSPKSTGLNSSGDRTITSECNSPVMEGSSGLLKEVMLAYAEKMAATASETAEKSNTLSKQGLTDKNRSEETVISPAGTVSTVSASNLPHVSPLVRPQAIVTPMSSKRLPSPPPSSKKEEIVLKAVRRDSIVELTDDTELIKQAQLVSSTQKAGSLDESNNNVVSISQSVHVDSGKPKTLQSSSRLSSPSVLHLSNESEKNIVSKTTADGGTVYTSSRQRTLVRKRIESVEAALALSPVIELPATRGVDKSENGNVVQDAYACPATCVNPSPSSSVATTVCCNTAPESVSSTVKLFSAKLAKIQLGSGALTSNISQSPAENRTGNVPTRSTALRRPVGSSYGVSRVSPTQKSSKLAKSRDSIGVARTRLTNNNNNNAVRRPTTSSSRTHIDENSISATTNVNVLVTRRNIENMRKTIEARLDTTLPTEREQLAARLSDGTILCNFANRIRTRCIPTVLTSTVQQVPLSLPKCRRNVENFLAACRRIGVSEISLCNASDILERKNLHQVAKTVIALNKFAPSSPRTESRRITNV